MLYKQVWITKQANWAKVRWRMAKTTKKKKKIVATAQVSGPLYNPFRTYSSAYSGEQNRPAKRMLLVTLCRMKKRKGWSALKVGVNLIDVRLMMAPVAAAASVPSSLTSTKALWTTFDRNRSLAGDMPVSREERESVAYPCTLKTLLLYIFICFWGSDCFHFCLPGSPGDR